MPELADLKAGDEVAIRQGMSDSYSLLQIKEITNRGTIILNNGEKYRSDGTPMDKGGKWHRPANIEVVTDEIRRSIRHSRLVSAIVRLNYNDWKAFDLETLEHIYAQIKLGRSKKTEVQ